MPKVKRVRSSRSVRYGKTPLKFRNPYYSNGAVLPKLKTSYTSLEGGVRSVEEAEELRKRELDVARQRAGIYTNKEKLQIANYKAAQIKQMIELYEKMARDVTLSDEERQQFGALALAKREKFGKILKKFSDAIRPDLEAFNRLPAQERAQFMTQYRLQEINKLRPYLSQRFGNEPNEVARKQRVKSTILNRFKGNDAVEATMEALNLSDGTKNNLRAADSPLSRFRDVRDKIDYLLSEYAGRPAGMGSFGDNFRSTKLHETLRPAIGYQRPVKPPKDWRTQQEERLQKRQDLFKKSHEALYGVTPSTDKIKTAMPETAEPISLTFMRL